jgi:hypothetical protein
VLCEDSGNTSSSEVASSFSFSLVKVKALLTDSQLLKGLKCEPPN